MRERILRKILPRQCTMGVARLARQAITQWPNVGLRERKYSTNQTIAI
jgi:hypothetical protein